MNPSEIRALDVPSNSIVAILLKELVAQVAQVAVNLAQVTGAGGVQVALASQASGGLPIVVEPTPSPSQPASSPTSTQSSQPS